MKMLQVCKCCVCGVVWCGVVWCGVVWCGVVWCGVVWCGVMLLEGLGMIEYPAHQVPIGFADLIRILIVKT